jgi:hypothetical protein
MATEKRRGLSAGESTPAVPQAKPTAGKPKAKPKPPAAAPAKPWWWYVTPAGIANEAKYRHQQIKRINQGSRYMGRVGIMPIYMDQRGRVSTSTPAQRDIIRGAVQVPLDVAKAGINVVQRATNGNKPADPASTPVGRAITQAERGLNTAMQLPQPEQRQPEDLFWQQMGNQFTTGVAGGLAAKAFVGANAFTQGAFRSLSPAAQQALRWTAGIGIESGVSTALTDNRVGNLANAFGENAPMAVQPTDDMVSSAMKSLIPNAGAEIAFGLAGLGLGKTFGNISRSLQESRAVQEVKGARNWAQENGIQVDNDGVSEFTPEAVQPTPKAEAPAAEPTAEPAATPAAAPAAAPTAKEAEDMLLGPDEEGPVYDPATPEVDVAIQALDRLDDERLQAVAAGAEGPVLPELDRQLGEQQATFQVQEGLDVEMVSAPSQNLANPEVPYEAQWQQLPQNTLISLAAPQNSPDLFQKVQALTGREFEQFTRMDVLDGLKALQAEGKTVLPSRLQDGVTATPVGELGVDPVKFQYKDNVNAQGQQKGNSLDGVTRWNTDLEQVNEVWTSPEDGVTYVINGHNSLAKAKELGIPTVLTKEILANTPQQARAIGALSNIAKGSGTVFDAAKVFRERGITDLAGLDDAGIPLRGGNNEPSLGAKGLALSKLPDNLFQAAINGELSLGRALALGNSGLDPEGMTRVVQLTQGRDMTERGFAELIEMASTAPKVESDQMGLFGAEVIDTTVIKAELAAKVRAELGSSKRLLAMAGKQKNAAKLAEKAGATVDAGQAKDAADVVKGVIEQFDQTKYAAETPISQLLNEGAAEIAAGAKPAVVAKRILAQLEKAAEVAPPAPRAPVEEPAVEGGLSQREIERYSQMSPEDLAKEKALADKYLLGDQALANRQAKWKAMQEQEAQVLEYNDNAPGSNSPNELTEEEFLAKWGADESTHPQLGKNSAYTQTKTALDRHEWAQAFNQWYEENVGVGPLSPEARNELKKQVVKRAIQAGEVRPSEAPLPEVPEGPRDLNDPQALLEDELRLAEEYAQQDAIRQQVELEAQRAAMGWDDMTLEQKKANGMLDSWEPEPVQAPPPPLEIPEAAGRKITARTSEDRIRGAAESLASWTRVPAQEPMSLEKALALVRAKGAIFDPDKLPGVDVDAARNDAAMGRSTPGTEAVSQAYKQFYGLNQSLSGIAEEQELIRSFDVGPAPDSMQAELREVVRDAVFRITGDDASVALHGYLLDKARPPEWGTKTKRIKEAGSYELVLDIVNVRGLLEASPDRVISTAYHESFHRIQFALMTQADMDVFDSVFGKIRVENYAGTRREIATIERQALAFQTFADAKANGLTTAADARARIRYEVIDALDEQFPRKNGESWEGTLTERVTSTIFQAFDRLLEFVERVNNGIRGRGFTSVEDFFEKAYAGDIAKKRALDFALEEITPDQKARVERLRTWTNDNQTALSDIGQAVAGIDVQINALKAQAIAGGC